MPQNIKPKKKSSPSDFRLFIESLTELQTRFQFTFGVIYFIGFYYVLIGLVSYLFKIEYLQLSGYGIITAGVGVIYLVLAFFVQRKSMPALIIAFIINTIDTGLLIYVQDYNLGLVVRIILWLIIAQGFWALRKSQAI
jgi:hypothetical protein